MYITINKLSAPLFLKKLEIGIGYRGYKEDGNRLLRCTVIGQKARHKSGHGEFQLIIWKKNSLWGQQNPGTVVQRHWSISTLGDL